MGAIDIQNGAATSAAAAAGWAEKYSVDFSSLDSQDITSGGDGAKTIDGKTWQAVNATNATNWDLDGSTGLVFDVANGTYDYGVSNRTSPHLYALLTSLWSDYNVANHLVRIWCQFSFTPVNAWDSFMCILERQGGTGGDLMCGGLFRHDSGSNDQFGIYHGSAGGANGFTQSAIHTTDDVMLIEQTERGMIFRTGTYSGGWPAIETMNLHGHVQFDASGDLLLGFEQTNAAVVLSNFKDSGAPADATVIRLRLDAK